MTIFQEKFSTGQVIKAAGISNATLQSWMKRDVISGEREDKIEGGGSPGRYRSFGFHTLMEIAVAKAVVDAGVKDLPNAFKAARGFAYTGTDQTAWHPEREPGLPFSNRGKLLGHTLLAVAEDRSYVAFWQSGADALADIRQALGQPEGFAMVFINEVFDRVMVSLNRHPEEVLEAAYGADTNA
ncbi:hypothetical protein FF124_10770 [Martelella lutilitoris]|uniref:MerR family transcriptional regulator n=1 Tax=Martelella lutilitoris TaxID=2583532 RepID=A0A5C4JRH3_9HYPH|nr:hypothetical protein [Martelella lutilitoris]TNB48055.1 hypothetical protein FF124_10770 [Martelella lutilitoris]